MQIFSVNITPLFLTSKKYGISVSTLTTLSLEFLSHRREELLNVGLSHYFDRHDIEIKNEIKTLLYEIIETINSLDGNIIFYIKGSYLYIKEEQVDE